MCLCSHAMRFHFHSFAESSEAVSRRLISCMHFITRDWVLRVHAGVFCKVVSLKKNSKNIFKLKFSNRAVSCRLYFLKSLSKNTSECPDLNTT